MKSSSSQIAAVILDIFSLKSVSLWEELLPSGDEGSEVLVLISPLDIVVLQFVVKVDVCRTVSMVDMQLIVCGLTFSLDGDHAVAIGESIFTIKWRDVYWWDGVLLLPLVE